MLLLQWMTLLVCVIPKPAHALLSRIALAEPCDSYVVTALRSAAQSEPGDGGLKPTIDDDYHWKDELVVDWDWENISQSVFRDDKRPVVLFDGVCNLCNSGVNFAMDQDENAKLRFCSLQSRVAQSLLVREGKPPNHGQISFITETEGYFSSNAVSHICMHLDSRPLQWFGAIGQYTPGWIRESVYQIVSKNRFQFGETDQCRLDFDGTYTSRFVSDPLEEGYMDYTI